jgi:hypothetical protein
MSRGKLKWSLRLATWSILIFVVLAVPAFGQTTLTIPSPQFPPGQNNEVSNMQFSNIIINPGGILTGTNLSLPFANFGGPIKVALLGQIGPATASLTNTTITLQNSTTGMSANGTGAGLTLSGFLNFINAGGLSNRFGVTATGGAQVSILDGSSLSLGFSGANNIGLNADGSGTKITVTGAIVSLPGTNTDLGVNVTGGAQAEIASSTLDESNSNGNNNTVLKAVGAGSTLSVTNTSVAMSGTNNDVGALATGGAEVQRRLCNLDYWE